MLRCSGLLIQLYLFEPSCSCFIRCSFVSRFSTICCLDQFWKFFASGFSQIGRNFSTIELHLTLCFRRNSSVVPYPPAGKNRSDEDSLTGCNRLVKWISNQRLERQKTTNSISDQQLGKASSIASNLLPPI